MPVHPYIPFLDCAEVELIGTYSGQIVEMTFGARFGSTIAPADLDQLLLAIDGWYHSDLRALLTASISFDSLKATDLTTVSSPTAVRSMSSPTQGSVVAATAPSNVAAVVKLTTAQRGRSFRGRNYVPGLAAGDLESPGELGTAIRSSLATAWVNFAGILAVNGWDHVVLSRRNNGAFRLVGVSTKITGYTVRAPVGTQRRRVPGVGI